SALGVQEIYANMQDKWPPFKQFLDRTGFSVQDICYMGDDLPDLPVMRKVGLPVCPNDAVPEVLDIAEYISPYKGGHGCVRDLLEKVLKLQGKWPVF
ncbi:MAG: KdsC family phosphatase, partial [Saprospiraceae bacterium]